MIFIFEILAMYTCGRMFAQGYKIGISGIYAPQDNGIGIKADYAAGRFGPYFGFSHGNYYGVSSTDQPFYIKDHNRFSGGITYWSGDSYLQAGVVYHTFGARDLGGFISDRSLRSWSMEYGVGCSVGRFRAGFRFDVIRWEGAVDVGINIIKLRH